MKESWNCSDILDVVQICNIHGPLSRVTLFPFVQHVVTIEIVASYGTVTDIQSELLSTYHPSLGHLLCCQCHWQSETNVESAGIGPQRWVNMPHHRTVGLHGVLGQVRNLLNCTCPLPDTWIIVTPISRESVDVVSWHVCRPIKVASDLKSNVKHHTCDTVPTGHDWK